VARLDLGGRRLVERDCRKLFSSGSRGYGRAAAGKRRIGKRKLTGDLGALGLVLRAGGCTSFCRAAAKIVAVPSHERGSLLPYSTDLLHLRDDCETAASSPARPPFILAQEIINRLAFAAFRAGC
jgi:hypothetical protein